MFRKLLTQNLAKNLALSGILEKKFNFLKKIRESARLFGRNGL